MKNLKNYGVQEMNTQEVNSVSGGSFPWFGYGFWSLWADTCYSPEDRHARDFQMI